MRVQLEGGTKLKGNEKKRMKPMITLELREQGILDKGSLRSRPYIYI